MNYDLDLDIRHPLEDFEAPIESRKIDCSI